MTAFGSLTVSRTLLENLLGFTAMQSSMGIKRGLLFVQHAHKFFHEFFRLNQVSYYFIIYSRMHSETSQFFGFGYLQKLSFFGLQNHEVWYDAKLNFRTVNILYSVWPCHPNAL